MYLFAKSSDPLDKQLIDELAAHIVARKDKRFMKALTKKKK
jgi:hypothetical protein